MKLDVQLRIAQAIGNLTFTSSESEQVFILFAHLPGFEKDEIEVSANEDGTEISVAGGGEREAQEVTISRRVAIAHEVSIGRFRKVFRIPSNVVLERIEAVFHEDEEILIVMMPKLIRGEPSRIEIEELQIFEPENEENGEPEEVDLPEKIEEEIEKLPSPESTEREVEVEKIDKTAPPELTEREVEVKFPEKTEEETGKRGHPEEPWVGFPVLEASTEPEEEEEEEDREVEIPARPPEFPKPTETVEFESEQPEEETEPENEISSPKPEIEERETMPEGDSETREPAGSPKPDENSQQIDEKIEEIEDRYPEGTVEPPDRDGHQSNSEDKENVEDGTIEPFETPDRDAAETQDRAPGTPQSTREPDEDLDLHQVDQQEQPEEEEEELSQTEEQEQPELETSAAIEQTEEKTEDPQGPEVSRSPEPKLDLHQPEEREIPAAEPERDPSPEIEIPNDLESIEPSKPDLDLQQSEEKKHETAVESAEEEQIPPESSEKELESLEGVNGGELNGEEKEGAEALPEERDSDREIGGQEVEDGIGELGGAGGGSGETGGRIGRPTASLPTILSIITLVVLFFHLLRKKRRER